MEAGVAGRQYKTTQGLRGKMNQDTFDNTLRQVERLSSGPDEGVLAPETLRQAASFLSQVHDALAAGGARWQEPTVEGGRGGAVVFLWQDGLRALSLIVGTDGAGKWVCAPGHSVADMGGLNFNSRLFEGTAAPEEFAQAVWSPWALAETPFA